MEMHVLSFLNMSKRNTSHCYCDCWAQY